VVNNIPIAMGERLIHIEVADGTTEVGRGLRRQINGVIEALKREGVVNENDEINVDLKPDVSVPHGRIGKKVKVQHVYRDGEKGPLDTVDETYRID
jgi:hypothetical protein